MRITQHTQETEAEKRERLQREREEMRLGDRLLHRPRDEVPAGQVDQRPYGLGKHRRPARSRFSEW